MGRGWQTGSVGGRFSHGAAARRGELPCLDHPEGSHLGFRKPWPGGRRQVSVSVRAQQPRTWTSQPTGPRLVHVMNTPQEPEPASSPVVLADDEEDEEEFLCGPEPPLLSCSESARWWLGKLRPPEARRRLLRCGLGDLRRAKKCDSAPPKRSF